MDNLFIYRFFRELIAPVQVATVADLLGCAIVVPSTALILGWFLKYIAVVMPYCGAAVGVIYFVVAIVKMIRRLFNVGC